MRPLIKWAGGKARLAPAIDTAFKRPCTGIYYEPFAGSLAVYLHRKAEGRIGRAVLSDANSKLIETHRAIRDQVDEVLEALARLPVDDWHARYYDVRDAFNREKQAGPEHAARFLWLNRACFNGLYRENRHGKFNVPVGAYERLQFPEPAAFRAVSALLQDADLRTSGFVSVMAEAGPGDQIYCDPPYVPLTDTASFTSYCAEPFGLVEQRALAICARDAARRGARVVLSNHDCALVRKELYPAREGFRRGSRRWVARAISQDGGRRNAVAEVIATIGPLL